MGSEDLNWKIKKPLTMDAEDHQEIAGSEEFLLQKNSPPFLCN